MGPGAVIRVMKAGNTERTKVDQKTGSSSFSCRVGSIISFRGVPGGVLSGHRLLAAADDARTHCSHGFVSEEEVQTILSRILGLWLHPGSAKSIHGLLFELHENGLKRKHDPEQNEKAPRECVRRQEGQAAGVLSKPSEQLRKKNDALKNCY
ncbi:hypothetical protein M513_05837 [Trichuris suis]|uniref:Uncharacterized protein n=1 Tax=Trichuris suis TaxID=68888 RepID=A0A085M810_9BILA|nr:hypothetical protein M513_05837 [Trichuris suis]